MDLSQGNLEVPSTDLTERKGDRFLVSGLMYHLPASSKPKDQGHSHKICESIFLLDIMEKCSASKEDWKLVLMAIYLILFYSFRGLIPT